MIKKRNKYLILLVLLILALGLVNFLLLQSHPTRTAVSDQPTPTPTTTPPAPAPSETFYLYYPYDTGTEVTIKEITAIVTLKPGETALQKICELLREKPQDGTDVLFPVLGPDAKILSAEPGNDQILKVNLNQAFLTEMNAGSGLEGAVLKCIVKTLTRQFGARGVTLQVEGKPYESGHYLFRAQDVLYPDHNF